MICGRDCTSARWYMAMEKVGSETRKNCLTHRTDLCGISILCVHWPKTRIRHCSLLTPSPWLKGVTFHPRFSMVNTFQTLYTFKHNTICKGRKDRNLITVAKQGYYISHDNNKYLFREFKQIRTGRRTDSKVEWPASLERERRPKSHVSCTPCCKHI